jgi:hypothetical protein
MHAHAPALCDDVSAADWIAPRLGGEFGAVGLQVPRCYEAFARICHPARDLDDRLVTWAEVAHATGRTPHALMQWHALVGSPDHLNFTGSLWPGQPPERGDLVPEVLRPLCELLERSTTTPMRCYFGVCEGWTWVRFDGSGSQAHGEWPPAAWHDYPRVDLPHREYLLWCAPVKAALDFVEGDGMDQPPGSSPNIFWPHDRAWFVASEIDFDSTLVGGAERLIDEILASSAFDAWAVGPDDSLAYDADTLNLV